MADTLNLFPSRAAIGRVDAAGNVYMTLEFTRAMAALLVRVGGPNANDLGELAVELATGANTAGLALARGMAALEAELAQTVQLAARLAELRKQVAALEAALVGVAPPTDWEHPGKIGASTASTGKFTTLEATAKVKLSPVDKDVEIKPTGVALVTIQPAQPGQLDNMELGKNTPRPARVTTLNGVTFTGTAGATLAVGGGGTLGTAAYTNSTAYASRSGTALAAAATDAATTQALANSLRSVLLSVGIGT